MSQYGRPESDVSATNFAGFTATTPGSLWDNIDESSPDDSNYVYTLTTSASYECGLSAVSDPGVHTGHAYRWRVALSGPLSPGEDPVAYTVSLYQGATLIASYAGSIGVATVTAAFDTLSSGEAAAITDYADLRLRFAVASATSPAVRFHWAELEVPDAPAADVVDIDGADVVLEPDDLGELPGEAAVDADGAEVVLDAEDAGELPGESVVAADGADVALEAADASPSGGIVVAVDGADLEFEAADATEIPGEAVVALGGADVVLDGEDIRPTDQFVDLDGADVPVETDDTDTPGEPEPTGPVPEPRPPDPPVVPGSESQRFVILPIAVAVAMPAQLGNGCSLLDDDEEHTASASFVFDLAYFDHTRPDGFREGWDPSNIRLGANSPSATDPQGVGAPLYPYWSEYFDEIGVRRVVRNLPSIASTFLCDVPGALPYEAAIGPPTAELLIANYHEANQVAMHAARDYYGWRVAGGDDRYEGSVAYPIDAHDDTLIFTYRDGEASVRVAPVPHLGGQESSQFHASGINCEREIGRFFVRRACTRSDGERTRTIWPWEERPVYADGTLGTVCKKHKSCVETTTECPDSTLCVRVGKRYSVIGDVFQHPYEGVPVSVLDADGNEVATGATDEAGYACFDLPGGDYHVKLRCSSPPYERVYECDRPFHLPPCGKTLTVKLGFCFARSCITAFDYDTGAGIDGFTVGPELDRSTIECDDDPETVLTGRDGPGKACLWVPHDPGQSIAALQTLDPAAFTDPFWSAATSCSPPAVHLGKWIGPNPTISDGTTSGCGADDCCGSRDWSRAWYDRAKWTKLIHWCGTYPACQGASRHPSMVPRRIFATINAPDPIWRNLNGVPIPLDFIGVRKVPGVMSGCVQVWDSGCLGGAGYYFCREQTYRVVGRSEFWETTGETEVDYASARVRLYVATGVPVVLGTNICTNHAGLRFENYLAGKCEMADPFDVLLDNISVGFGTLGADGNPDCGPCSQLGTFSAGDKRYCSAYAPVPGTEPITGNPCSAYLGWGFYPSGVRTHCFGRNGSCVPITGPDCTTAGSVGGCRSRCTTISGPVDYSGVYQNCQAFEGCRWSANYELFE